MSALYFSSVFFEIFIFFAIFVYLLLSKGSFCVIIILLRITFWVRSDYPVGLLFLKINICTSGFIGQVFYSFQVHMKSTQKL